jgi:hypothetical protein
MDIRAPIRGNSSGPGRHGGMARLSAALAALCLGLSLSACASTDSADIIAAPKTVEATNAMVLPAPGGPSIVSVIEERFSDGVKQKIVLGTDAANPGQNYLEIRLYGPMERATQGRNKLGFKAFAAAGLTAEAARAMPGVPMTVSALFLRNSYGPFGYAFGRSKAGDACIYGWQQLRSTKDERAGFRNAGAIQIRLRLCQAGAGEKELLSVLYGYTINGSFGSEQWNPFGEPKDVSSTLGTGGDPVYPRDEELAAPADSPVASPVRRKVAATESRNDTTDELPSTDDETAAKAIVDVPAPQEVNPDAESAEDTGQSPVVVPGPGCDDGNLSCN